ncbi:MAG TPA: hypothetical protein VJ953_17140 [Saprospiraceae bacterium]|nr:hypothetical protein [Saprospiraceae bacterium]
MKNSKFLLLGLLLILVFSCQQDDNLELNPKYQKVLVANNSEIIDINTKVGIDKFVKSVVGDDEIKIVEAELKELRDELGIFYAVKTRYQKEKIEQRPVTIVLENYTSSQDGASLDEMIFAAGCKMTCKPESGCTGCQQEIIVRCQSQTCECSNGSAGCTSNITFPDPEQ